MSGPIHIQIVGAPIACKEGVKDTWREVAGWAEGQLKVRFGDAVQVKYYDLFDAECPPVPEDARLPLIMADGTVVSSGGKISVPALRRAVEARLHVEHG